MDALLAPAPLLVHALCALAVAAPQAETPDLARLTTDAQSLIPAYRGEHRSYLSETERIQVTAGVRLLEAVELLAPENTSALWWQAHARILLAEDRRNRGEAAAAQEQDKETLRVLDQSLLVDPRNAWAHYSKGTVFLNADDPWSAIESLDRAVALLDQELAGSTPSDSAPWLRYFARKWRAEALMRAYEHERARDEWRAFYADHGNNAWDLGFALAQSHLRERDFAGAGARFDEVIAVYPNDFSAVAERAYVAGLVEDRELATSLLTRAVELELEPTLYPRMWLWILATPASVRERARADLAEFVENPPASLAPWDQRLGLFLLGSETPSEFLAAARSEEQRRKTAGLEVDDLLCEAHYYAGLRLESDGEPASALASYRAALEFEPRAFKWEWAFSRLRYARLAQTLAPAVEGHEALPLDEALHVGWHVPGASGSVPALERSPRPGDLLQCVLRRGDRPVFVAQVFTARTDDR